METITINQLVVKTKNTKRTQLVTVGIGRYVYSITNKVTPVGCCVCGPLLWATFMCVFWPLFWEIVSSLSYPLLLL